MAPSRHVLSLVVAGTAAVQPLALTAGPAWAHGAPVSPVSRAAACASGSGQYVGTPACRAAAAASGTSRPFAGWDNLGSPVSRDGTARSSRTAGCAAAVALLLRLRRAPGTRRR
jgi:predicted carbohydrate-binding protein with CBM5 and CBM33 domain